MATLAAPDLPSIPPLMTWAEICATYPEQHILVEDTVFHDGTVVSARVLNYEIRAREGVIIAERADTGPVSAAR